MKLYEAPAGRPLNVRSTFDGAPLTSVTVTGSVRVSPGTIENGEQGGAAETEKSNGPLNVAVTLRVVVMLGAQVVLPLQSPLQPPKT